MKYLLIDTNSWIDLFLNIDEEKNLDQILKWTSDGKIKLLIPATLDKEFIKQKKVQLDLLKKRITAISNTARKETLKDLKKGYADIESKIKEIEAVFLKGIKIRTSNKVHEIVGKRYQEELAPFHNNLKSHNDAYLFFETIEYLQKKGIPGFVFITRNSNDFSAPGSSNTEIHPELRMANIDIEYISPIAFAVNKLQKELGADKLYQGNSSLDYADIFYIIPKPGQNKIGKELHDVLHIYQEELPFLPLDLLARTYPFKTEASSQPETYSSSFQINSNNEKLLKFLTSLRVGKMNSIHFKEEEKGHGKKAKEEIKEILSRLESNLIYDVRGIGNNLHADVRLKTFENCDCIHCTYNRFEIYKAYTMLDNMPADSTRDTLKQAYLHYQFQRYEDSLKLFYSVYKKSEQKEQTILLFICLTNLKRLSRLIESYGKTSDPGTKEIIKEIAGISLRQKRGTMISNNPFVNEVIDFMAGDNFLNQAMLNISATVEKIRDHYTIQLKGGSSSNSNLEILLSQFAETDIFLETNCFIYNNYLEFEKLTDKLVEGLFMILSFNSRQNSRIKYIDDYLLSRIIMFAKPETIIKHYKGFNLPLIKYRKNDKVTSKLAGMAMAFFWSLEQLHHSEEYLTTGRNFFFNKNKKLFNNFLLMLTLAEEVFDFNLIFEKLFPVLSHKELILQDELKSLTDFILIKGKFVTDDNLKRLLQFALENKKFHEFNIFNALAKQIIKKGILISEKSFNENIKLHFLGICPLCNHTHIDILCVLFTALSGEFKDQIKVTLTKSLQEHFNPDNYYLLAIHGVIDYTSFLDNFKALCVRPLGKKGMPTHPMLSGEIVLYRLSELLNIYFKNGLDTKEEFFKKLQGFSNFYDWILDVEEFDYKKFNPLWILEYQTQYYMDRIFRSPRLKQALVKYLKTNKHTVLSELFIKYM